MRSLGFRRSLEVGAPPQGVAREIEPRPAGLAAVGVRGTALFICAFVLVRPLLDYFRYDKLEIGFGVALNVAAVAALVLICVALAACASGTRPLWPAATAVLAAVLVVSVLAAVHTAVRFDGLRDQALQEILRLLALAAMFFLASTAFPRVRDVRLLFVVVGLSGVAPALVALYQWAFVHPLALVDLVRVYGTFSHPNALGEYLALSSLILIWLPRPALPLWLRLTALAPILGALVGTVSRTGWALFLVGLLVLGWRRYKRPIVVGVVAAAALAMAIPTLRDDVLRSEPDSTASGVPYSYRWRLDNWEGLLSKYSSEPLLGYGLRSTGAVNPKRGYDAHNTAVALLVEGGPCLLAAWAALFFTVLRLTRSAARGSWPLQAEAGILFALWVAVTFVALTGDDPLAGTALMFALSALTGAFAGAVRRRTV